MNGHTDVLFARRPVAMGVAAAALAIALLWTALAASPALAATTWQNITPDSFAPVGRTNIVEAEAIDDTYAIVSATLTINGVTRAPLIVSGLITQDVWITFDPAQDGLLDPGVNHAVATVTNAHGDISTQAWDFTVNTPPTIQSFSPLDNALVTASNSPTVTITLYDLDVPETFTGQFSSGRSFTVDGGAVASSMVNDAVAKTYTFSFKRSYSQLVWHTVVFSVKDSAGNPVTMQWRFMIDTSPDTTKPTLTNPSPIPGASTNRKPTLSITATDNRAGNLTVRFLLGATQVYSQSVPQGVTSWAPTTDLPLGSNTVTAEATDASGNKQSLTWSFTVEDNLVASHTTTTDFTTCSKCHDPVLTTEHENHGFNCTTCHGASAPQNVQDAISARNTACDACHSQSPHTSLHEGGLPAGGGCSECHKTSISAEHDDNCDGCHKSTDANVIAAISSGNGKCAACHSPGIHAPGFYRYGQDYYKWDTTPGPWGRGTPLGSTGSNPANPGVHANYLATTAKCGICHSVHRAVGDGAKLLPTGDATCAGCHTGGTAITAKIITVAPINTSYKIDGSAGAAGGGGGPHNDGPDTLFADGVWDGAGTPPAPSFALDTRYGCFTRRCHATNPHGANSSKYKIFAAKLLFNDSPAQDDAEYPELVAENGNGTYGGDDAVYDNLGATDAAVKRFADANPGIITVAGGDILIHGVAPDPAETHALVAGLTCGRPSNPGTGEDECHAEASYAIVDKGIRENRNHATGLTQAPVGTPGRTAAYTTDNTGAELPGFGGNDNRDAKTGHVAGTFAAVPGAGSYAAVAGCTSCHDQTDSANTTEGNYTFPHGQTPVGSTNASTAAGATGTGVRSRIWAGFSGSVGASRTVTAGTPEKAFDGQCLKCHRDGSGNGIGLTK
jgi:hypothetical protein